MSARGGAVGLLALAFRVAVGAVFVYASLGKIADPAGFARAVHNYHFLPLPLLHPFALALPWAELVCGLALVLGTARRGAALLLTVLLLAFMVAIGSALARDLDISCGCFQTEGGEAVGISLLVRDLALLLAALVPLLGPRDRWGLDALTRRGRRP